MEAHLLIEANPQKKPDEDCVGAFLSSTGLEDPELVQDPLRCGPQTESVSQTGKGTELSRTRPRRSLDGFFADQGVVGSGHEDHLDPLSGPGLLHPGEEACSGERTGSCPGEGLSLIHI